MVFLDRDKERNLYQLVIFDSRRFFDSEQIGFNIKRSGN